MRSFRLFFKKMLQNDYNCITKKKNAVEKYMKTIKRNQKTNKNQEIWKTKNFENMLK